MKLLKMATQIIDIANDLRYRLGSVDFDNGDLYDFDQTWASTTLGFGGVGGSAMTTERTYVFIPDNINTAYVYFGSRFAYAVNEINDRFKEDLRNHRMRSVMESGRYSGK